MPVNLLAICRQGPGLILKSVVVTPHVQGLLEGLFIEQEQSFFDGINNEIVFDGGWKPENNELLIAPVTPDISAIRDAALGNVIALPTVDPNNLANEHVRALAVLTGPVGSEKLLIQNFSARQLLERRFALIYDGNTFNRLSEPAFTLGTGLAGVLDHQFVKFKSFSNVKMIFDLQNLYREATDAQIDQFGQHAAIGFDDANTFKANADQTMRKLVHAISQRGTLDALGVAAISAAAAAQAFVLNVANGKIVLPSDRSSAKNVLHFLDEGFYRGALTGDPYITNSKRRMDP